MTAFDYEAAAHERNRRDKLLRDAAPELLQAAKCALADLQGIMPEFEPSGDREHPAWQTIEELYDAITKATGA